MLSIAANALMRPGEKQPNDFYIVMRPMKNDEGMQAAEIIEFPCVIVDARSAQVISEFRQFVKPSLRTSLSIQCMERARISQSDIDAAQYFPEVLLAFLDWLRSQGFDPEDDRNPVSFALVMFAQPELEHTFAQLCQLREPPLALPRCFRRWIDVKSLFEIATGYGLHGDNIFEQFLQILGIINQQPCSGITEAHCIASALISLLQLRCRIDYTGVMRCYNCGQEGHFVRNCPSSVHGARCHGCGQEGHFLRDCPNGGGDNVRCFACNQPGHYARNCPFYMPNDQSQELYNTQIYYTPSPYVQPPTLAPQPMPQAPFPQRSTQACFRCGDIGHFARNCPKYPGASPTACFACGQEGHFSRDCVASYPQYIAVLPQTY